MEFISSGVALYKPFILHRMKKEPTTAKAGVHKERRGTMLWGASSKMEDYWKSF
jgi:hypothetical protein